VQSEREREGERERERERKRSEHTGIRALLTDATSPLHAVQRRRMNGGEKQGHILLRDALFGDASHLHFRGCKSLAKKETVIGV
jgi:hypothetical protein